MNKIIVSVLALLVFVPFAGAKSLNYSEPIKLEEVQAAQKAWGSALIKISTEYDNKGLRAAKEAAKDTLDELYMFEEGPVLFKPTLTTAPLTFRTTRSGALAYFVGDNKDYPDKGFALSGWRGFTSTNIAVFIDGNIAVTMGKVSLTNAKGEVTTVDKTWGFKKDESGDLRIFLHHSSLPFVSAQ
jgi:hypothetical protein